MDEGRYKTVCKFMLVYVRCNVPETLTNCRTHFSTHKTSHVYRHASCTHITPTTMDIFGNEEKDYSILMH